ncbi:alpha/beta fold hydrolase [Oceanicoccus sp. KOV_DT_Chl]|uniref:alpha/beta fold hydrolase n=1 Tax=Oceanicoccus sp. KOV_DT_Chl TaxID=1904639 RepID=UPI000C7B5535|nr:alpha/beta hydrolase [Oceanicoccus sp. KOV_DT_Chl]
MKLIWKLIGYPFIALFALIALYILWVLIAYRDIPISELEAKYGGGNVQRHEVDGVSLAYKVEGEGPAIVLIHSHYWTMRFWQPWVDVLKKDYTVIRYDLTSHGLTGPDPTEDYSRKRASVLLESLVKHIGVEKFSLVGSSTGGAIAFYYAATRPEQVRDLVMINTPGMPKVSNKYMERGLPSWGGYIFYLLPESIFRAFLEAPVVDKSLITDEVIKEFHEMYRGSGNRMAEFHRMRGWERDDPSPLLKKITAPTLIVWGEKNPQLPVESVAQFEERLVNAQRVEKIIYPFVGHIVPFEIPQQSVIDVEKFISSNLDVNE